MGLKVYIAAPYTVGDVAVNVGRAMSCADTLMTLGFAPYTPHLSHFLHVHCPRPYGDWLELDNQFLVVCDAVLRLPGLSKGADEEVAFAQELGIPIFYSVVDLVTKLGRGASNESL